MLKLAITVAENVLTKNFSDPALRRSSRTFSIKSFSMLQHEPFIKVAALRPRKVVMGRICNLVLQSIISGWKHVWSCSADNHLVARLEAVGIRLKSRCSHDSSTGTLLPQHQCCTDVAGERGKLLPWKENFSRLMLEHCETINSSKHGKNILSRTTQMVPLRGCFCFFFFLFQASLFSFSPFLLVACFMTSEKDEKFFVASWWRSDIAIEHNNVAEITASVQQDPINPCGSDCQLETWKEEMKYWNPIIERRNTFELRGSFPALEIMTLQ